MSYVSNVPVSGQSLNSSRDLINGNFQVLSPYGNGFSFFTTQLTVPSFSSDTDYLYVYAFNGANELFVHKQTTAGLSEVPFTASVMSLSDAADSMNGWSYLPSGLLVKWGTVQAASAIIFTVDVGSLSGGPDYSTVFQTYLTPVWAGSLTAAPSSVFLTASGTTVAGNFTCFVTNYDSMNSYLSYLVIGI